MSKRAIKVDLHWAHNIWARVCGAPFPVPNYQPDPPTAHLKNPNCKYKNDINHSISSFGEVAAVSAEISFLSRHPRFFFRIMQFFFLSASANCFSYGRVLNTIIRASLWCDFGMYISFWTRLSIFIPIYDSCGWVLFVNAEYIDGFVRQTRFGFRIIGSMAYAAMKSTKPGLEDTQEQIHKIRITLSSKNVKNLEKGIIFSFGFAAL